VEHHFEFYLPVQSLRFDAHRLNLTSFFLFLINPRDHLGRVAGDPQTNRAVSSSLPLLHFLISLVVLHISHHPLEPSEFRMLIAIINKSYHMLLSGFAILTAEFADLLGGRMLLATGPDLRP
jgi:hypothetical protein